MATFSVEALCNNYCNWGQIGQRLARGSTQDCCETPVHLEWSSDFHVPAEHHRSPAWAAGYALKPARPKSLLHLMQGPQQQGQEHHESRVAAKCLHTHKVNRQCAKKLEPLLNCFTLDSQYLMVQGNKGQRPRQGRGDFKETPCTLELEIQVGDEPSICPLYPTIRFHIPSLHLFKYCQ